MKNKLWWVLIPVVIVIIILLVVNSKTGDGLEDVNQPVSVIKSSKAKEFVDAMQKELGADPQTATSSKQIPFPRSNGDSGPSNIKTVDGYSFYFTGSAASYNDYLRTTIGPGAAWLANEREVGYINDSILCIQIDGSSGNAYAASRSSEIFCADLN